MADAAWLKSVQLALYNAHQLPFDFSSSNSTWCCTISPLDKSRFLQG